MARPDAPAKCEVQCQALDFPGGGDAIVVDHDPLGFPEVVTNPEEG